VFSGRPRLEAIPSSTHRRGRTVGAGANADSISLSLVDDTMGGALLESLILVGVIALLSMQAFIGFGSKVEKTMQDQALDTAKMGL
jgi:hypothetical protein